MASIAALARKKLLDSIAEIDTNEYTLEDTLRAFQQESKLLAITECIRSKVEHLNHDVFRMEVLDYHKSATRDDYVLCLATVQFRSKQLASSENSIRLFFRYERHLPTVSYAVDVATSDQGLRQTILWIQIWAAGNGPTANCLLLPPPRMEGEDSSTSDVDRCTDGHGTDVSEEPVTKKPKLGEKGLTLVPSTKQTNTSDAIEPEDVEELPQDDTYTAGVDPSLFPMIDALLTVDANKDEDHASVCSFLLSFAFYEGEWDLPGMLFDAIFDDDGSDSECSSPSAQAR